MSKRKNVPEIRFKGFNNAWEQRKLGDFIEDYIEKTTIQNQYPVLTSSQQMGIVLQEEYFANRQVTTSENVGYFVLPKGYFTYRSRSDNDVFVFNRNDLIDKGIISYFYPVFRVKNADSDFFLRRLNFGIERQISIAAEGTGQHVLSLKKFKDVVAMFPSVQEQTKIGAFFRNLDNLITLYQQKLDKLKELKRAYLDQIFNQKIRFLGFSNKWEQRKFRGFIFKAGEKNTLDKNYPAYSVSNKLGLVSQTEQFDGSRLDNLDKTSYKLVNPNEFAYNPARINVGSIAFNNFNKTVIVSSLYVVFKISEKLDNEFILQFIKSQSFINEVKRNTEGSVREYLFFENFRNIKFPYTSKNEQVRIGEFFKQIDNTIALYQSKIDKLNKIKQGFLQKMFI
jgi:type I restriction enzyme S subunit